MSKRRAERVAGALAALLLSVSGCGPAPAPPEAARVSPPAASSSAPNPGAGQPARDNGSAEPSLSRGTAVPAAPRSREQRRSERAQRAFAAGRIEIAEAQRGQVHGRLVEFDGTVEKLLRPDRRGLPHQRFLVRVAGSGTLLIAHNTQLGGQVPLAVGQRVRVRGLFEWNPRGGVVHWTHHDPAGGSGAGWIRTDGKTYQ